MSILIISDIHLCIQNSNITDRFLHFLKCYAIHARSLYILGDLFEIWLGDDNYNSLYFDIAEALKKLKQKKVLCYFIHGNHDFLLGKKYANACGVILLPSKQVVTLESGKKIVILHGDTLCIHDKSYQLFRRLSRNAMTQRMFLALPLFVRSYIFNFIRFYCVYCKQYILNKKFNMINCKMITDILIKNNAEIMIHGHTHQPAMHKIYKSEKEVFKVMVLGCWDKYGSMIEINEKNDNITFTEFSLNKITGY